MSRTDNNNAPLSLDTPIDEDRVRRALGLKTGGPQHQHQQRPEQARQRHKFITDGAVPVVMLNRADSETVALRERIAALETTLENERAAHAGTRRALHDLQAAHQTLQTQARHHDMAQADSLKAALDGRRAAEDAVAALRAELAQERSAAQERKAPESAPASVISRVRTARVATGPAKEPKPVRWWTPSYRAKK